MRDQDPGTFTRMREATGVQSTTSPHQTTDSRTAKICHAVLRLAAAMASALPCELWGRPGKGDASSVTCPPLLPYHRAPSHPCFPGTAHRGHWHSTGTQNTPGVSIPQVPEVRLPLPLA